MKLPTIPPGLAGKIVKNRPLSEPITLQELEDSARSQAWKKINIYISFKDIFIRLKHISSTQNRTCLNTRETKRRDKKVYIIIIIIIIIIIVIIIILVRMQLTLKIVSSIFYSKWIVLIEMKCC